MNTQDQIFNDAIAHSLLGEAKMRVLDECLNRTLVIEGDCAEVGVYKGGSARLIAKRAPNKTVHLFDTFTGTPFQGKNDTHPVGDFGDTSEQVVRQLLSDCPNTEFHVGLFPETAHGIKGPFSLVHLDGDQYQTTKDALEFFYSQISEGGIILLDDYEWEHCPGVKQALREFLANKPETLEIRAPHQALIVKGMAPGGAQVDSIVNPRQIQEDGPGYTKAHEVAALVQLAQQTTGTIIEIGCNRGRTTRALAEAFPSRKVVGIDTFDAQNMAVQQQYELPVSGEIGLLARDLPNVLIYQCGSCSYNYQDVVGDDFVFIDGAHDYSSVKADTAAALSALKRGGIIAWHDYYEGQPDWCGVKKLVDECVKEGLTVHHILGTWLAWCHVREH